MYMEMNKCIQCSKELINKRSDTKYCNRACREKYKYWNREGYKEKAYNRKKVLILQKKVEKTLKGRE